MAAVVSDTYQKGGVIYGRNNILFFDSNDNSALHKEMTATSAKVTVV